MLLLAIETLAPTAPARAAADACAAIADTLPVAVTLDPSTTWQPRGGEVLLNIRASAADLRLETLTACFGWELTKGITSFDHLAAVMLHPYDSTGVAEAGVTTVGVTIPMLPDAWRRRNVVRASVHFTALAIVPVAQLRLVGVTAAGKPVVIGVPMAVGVTSLGFSVLATCAAVLLGGLLIYLLRVRTVPSAARTGFSAFLLQVVATPDHRAGLAQTQILLWTFVIGASAVYVMCLSGTLVEITNGTLQLLGIAAIATLGATVQTPPVGGGGPGQPAPPPVVVVPVGQDFARFTPAPAAAGAATSTGPNWSDLIASVDGSGEIDVTRVQMLLFTLVTAGFVLLKVVATYRIPVVPDGYLLLLGISNGTYLAGRYISLKT